ncbi:MAG: DUF6327 family protein [Bacteroidota bacterium]|nr:DUF6327 family protein [Bacteroidota bacterium]
MKTKGTYKQYKSYQQIDEDLRILKLEKEIHWRKLLQSGDNIKQSFKPLSLLPDLAIGGVNTFMSGAKGAVIGYLLKILFKRR